MIEKWLLLVDFGLMLLIWLVQIIIYPGFRYYAHEDLLRWHSRYTVLITYFVLPLMFAQLAGHLWLLWLNPQVLHALVLLCIASSWAVTFLVEVPYHSRVGAGEDLSNNIDGLIRWNWPRTAAWSLTFALSMWMF